MLVKPETSNFESRIRLADPKLLDKGFSALRFSVEYLDGEGRVFLFIPGFRVMKGYVKPPSRMQGKFSVDCVEIMPKFMNLLEKMVSSWRDDFPQVEFPLVEKEGQ